MTFRSLIKCPVCGHLENDVKDSRGLEGSTEIRRRRKCLHCGQRFTTIETYADASREPRRPRLPDSIRQVRQFLTHQLALLEDAPNEP
jgi:hypothetical protein